MLILSATRAILYKRCDIMSKEKRKGLNTSTIRRNIKYFGIEKRIRKGVLLDKIISFFIIELDTKQ